MDQALVLRGEDHVHEDDREDECGDEFGEGPLQLAPAPGDRGGVARRQPEPRRRLLQGLQPVCEAVARSDGSPQAHLPLPVEPVDARRRLGALEGHDVVEAHRRPVSPRDEQARDPVRPHPVPLVEPQRDIVVLVRGRIEEARHSLVASDHQAHGRGDVLGIDAEIGGPRAVDHDPELRLVELERRVGVDDAELRRHVAELLRGLRQRPQVRAAQHEVDVPVPAADVEALRVPHRRADIGELAQPSADLLTER